MSSPRYLPPPPPPVELQSWPDRAARLADRARALEELRRRLLGAGRLTLFLVWFLLLQIGWGTIAAGLAPFIGRELTDPISLTLVVFLTAVGIGIFVPAVWLTVRSLLRDRTVRERLVAWAALDRDAAADARLRAPGLSVCWLLLSFALCATGLWIAYAVPSNVTRDNGGYPLVVYAMGAAMILWVTGLTGLAKAVGHYRMAIRLTGAGAGPGSYQGPDAAPSPVTAPPAVRSASSGLPRPE
ncbi:hypothetical protein [Streptomyces laurentii]|uniref:hypothetical protein n=1 Tax=Streptomyces laurentii TaxID=39478 RepID=UPI00369377C7